MLQVNINKVAKLEFNVNEAYKALRTNVEFCGKNIKVIMLTSCTPDEGKSSVSFELARSFAEADKKVLLIDCDIRKSVMISRLQVDREVNGLSQYLTGKKRLDEIIYETNIPNLDMIFTGPTAPNPSELLGSEDFSDLLKFERNNYNYVIVDTPPLGGVIDGAIVAKNCDGALIVVESGAISYKMVQRVKEQLQKSGCSVLGAVLNKVDMQKRGYYGRYYGKYYGKYYGHNDNK